MDSFYFRRNSEIEETLRRFCRDKDLQKSSSRRSKVSDSQKTSEKSLEVSPWEFRGSFRLKSRKAPGPPAPMPKQLSARRSEQRSFPGSKLVRREVTFGFLSRGAGRKAR